jgi:hypothetical protein
MSYLLKGIESIILLKKWLGKNCRKNNHTNLRSNNYDVCTAAAYFRCYGPRKYIYYLQILNMKWYFGTAYAL